MKLGKIVIYEKLQSMRTKYFSCYLELNLWAEFRNIFLNYGLDCPVWAHISHVDIHRHKLNLECTPLSTPLPNLPRFQESLSSLGHYHHHQQRYQTYQDSSQGIHIIKEICFSVPIGIHLLFLSIRWWEYVLKETSHPTPPYHFNHSML